jgi:pyridoxine kinase
MMLCSRERCAMPTILSLSSQVARGHVGHSAAIFAWQRLGIEVVALPTILLSNRPDYPHRAAERIRPEFLSEMVAALDANGWLGEIDAVFTGYLPSAAHVALAAGLVDRLRAARPDLLYGCDPILGDEPGGLYIAEDAANAMRDTLLPLADLVTPNRFELGWLAGEGVRSAEGAVRAARLLARPMVLATSAPGDSTDELTNLLVEGGKAWGAVVGRRAAVPHGTGDLVAALFFGHLLRSRPAPEALALATAGIEAVIDASEGREELNLIASQESWAAPGPWPVTPIDGVDP